jgi:hypothetical protein
MAYEDGWNNWRDFFYIKRRNNSYPNNLHKQQLVAWE